MHEAGISQEAFDIVQSLIRENESLTGKKILKLVFSQNILSVVSSEAFEFYFSELQKGTVLESAVLEFRHTEKEGFFLDSIEAED